MEEKKSLGKELQEKLTFTQPHIADEQPDAVAEAERFCVDYKMCIRDSPGRGACPRAESDSTAGCVFRWM